MENPVTSSLFSFGTSGLNETDLLDCIDLDTPIQKQQDPFQLSGGAGSGAGVRWHPMGAPYFPVPAATNAVGAANPAHSVS